MARREYKLPCKTCGRFFRTTRKSDRHCPKHRKEKEARET